MVSNISLLLILLALTSVTAQTFQYSRGWTNGKRAHKDNKDALESRLTPCQLGKIKYILEGRPLNERLFTPCDFPEEDDGQLSTKRYKNDHSAEIMDVFQ